MSTYVRAKQPMHAGRTRCLRGNRASLYQHHVPVPVRHWYVPRIR
ncbi:hypothetical protein E2C01_063980 [Portunus trituberculatus]|uniref:Uncharacterized protein n=1 Tax=Portunus trituberculatus TaxID=210409 RepID=A0A5B7HJ40_PORTR|nr:hypothetical protein [Portunus trituberculatus]